MRALVLLLLVGCSVPVTTPEEARHHTWDGEMDGDAGFVNPPSGYDHKGAAYGNPTREQVTEAPSAYQPLSATKTRTPQP
jgi:hypothetical protein